MKLLLVRHLWGVDLSGGLATHLPRWRAVGYGALEVSPRLVPDIALLKRTLRDEGLRWIPQLYSHRGTLREHLQSLREQIEVCLDAEPLFFNAHTGSDAWSLAEAVDFYGAAAELERELGVVLAHETHRSRYFNTPWATAPILERFPDLKLTCDFSHWVCAAESLLGDCGPIMRLAASRARHLHARVGYEQGPQVPDPRDNEVARHLQVHEAWWDEVWAAQRAAGREESTLTPEFGPPPYLHTLPYTNEPVADLADICDWMARRQAERFGRLPA